MNADERRCARIRLRHRQRIAAIARATGHGQKTAEYTEVTEERIHLASQTANHEGHDARGA